MNIKYDLVAQQHREEPQTQMFQIVFISEQKDEYIVSNTNHMTLDNEQIRTTVDTEAYSLDILGVH